MPLPVGWHRLVELTVEMEWFDGHVHAAKGSLQEAPGIIECARVGPHVRYLSCWCRGQ